MRGAVLLLLPLLLAGCTEWTCIGEDAYTTLSWREPDLVARTPALDWGAGPSLPLPRERIGIPSEGAVLEHVDQWGAVGEDGPVLLAHNATHARFFHHADGTASRAAFLAVAANATSASDAQREAWAGRYMAVSQASHGGGTVPVHELHVPHDALRLEAWWDEEEPVSAPKNEGTSGVRPAWVGASSTWAFLVDRTSPPSQWGESGSVTFYGDGRIQVSFEGHLSGREARTAAAAWVEPLGLSVPGDADHDRSCG